MTIKFGNWPYFLTWIILLGVTALLYFILRNKTKRTQVLVIFIIAAVNTVLHFSKVVWPMDRYLYDLPYSVARISPENLCAVSVIVLPFVILFGGQKLKDSTYLICIVSAIAVYAFVTEGISFPLDNAQNIAEFIRYYGCHLPLFVCPMVLLLCGTHKLSYKSIPFVPLFFFLNMTIIFGNRFLLKWANIIPCTWEEFFSRNFANPSLVFGFPASFDKLSWIYNLVFPFFKYTTSTGDIGFIPILYLFVPVYIVIVLLCIAVVIPADYRDFKVDLETKRQIRYMKKIERSLNK